MKIVIIGANHAGIAATNTLINNYKEHQITLIERNSNISYLGCGTALWVGRQIDSYHELFYTSPEDLKKKGAKVYIESSVEDIDFEGKSVFCVKKDGSAFSVNYDKLILATGSLPIHPVIPGNDLQNIKFLKLFQEGQEIDKLLNDNNIQTCAVVGAGYIGVEIAEAMRRRGKNVLLFDIAERSLCGYFDEWHTADMDKILADNGVELHLGENVSEYKGTNGVVSSIVSSKGEYPVQLVINSIGFKPNALLGKEHLQRFDNGAYLVDNHQKTSDDDVYAIGDCATIYSNALQQTTYIALATNAVRSGIIAGHNVSGTKLDAIGVQGSNGISVYGYNMVSTGISAETAKKHGIDVKTTRWEDLQKPVFIKHNNEKVKISIIYEATSRRIVGAQISSRFDMSAQINLFSLAIQEKLTIDKLALLDIFFLPHFDQPYNYITMAALSAE
ncbi:NADH oxidase [Bacteroidia bacterium]|nr:NADH oxidase [Bacteroidia bacterium]